MPGPIDGVTIVDLTTVVLGPWATQMLGDLGAEVIKVEAPGGDPNRQMGPARHDGMASMYLAINRNKRSVVLDLKSPEGRAALERLMGDADVLVHNLRPAVAARLGLESEALCARYPGLIVAAAYGFSARGPMADLPAYDDVIQAACGLAALQARAEDQPRYVPTIMADKTSALYLVQAVLAALVHKTRTGEGQAIEVPMFEAMVDFLMVEHLAGESFRPEGGAMGYPRVLAPMRKPYATRDGYLAVLPYSDRNWADFLRLAGRADMIDDPRFASIPSRVTHSDAIYGILADILAERTTAEWEALLDGTNIPVQRVNSLRDLLTDAQLEASGFWRAVEHPTEGPLRMATPPVRFSRTPAEIRHLAPQLGADTEAVLRAHGLSEDEIAALKT